MPVWKMTLKVTTFNYTSPMLNTSSWWRGPPAKGPKWRAKPECGVFTRLQSHSHSTFFSACVHTRLYVGTLKRWVSFLLLLALLLIGGVEQNPGPVSDFLCGLCCMRVTYCGYSVCCSLCDLWYHRKCSNLSLPEIRRLRPDHTWRCPSCSTTPPPPLISSSSPASSSMPSLPLSSITPLFPPDIPPTQPLPTSTLLPASSSYLLPPLPAPHPLLDLPLLLLLLYHLPLVLLAQLCHLFPKSNSFNGIVEG